MTLLVAVAVVYGLVVVRDFHKYVRKATTAIDRDQQIMDAIDAREPEYLSLEEAEIIAVHVAGMSREDALVAFIDAYDERYHSDRSD